MKARLISIMLWAEDDFSDDEVANEVLTSLWDCCFIPGIERRPLFSKSVTIPDDKVSDKAAIIFGEIIRPEGEGRGE